MSSNFERLHEIINQAYAENFSILTKKNGESPPKSISSFPNRDPLLGNLHRRFDWHYIGQIYGGDFANFCGLLRICEL